MKFNIDIANQENLADAEISDLLQQTYVDAGYTTAEVAATLFAPHAVRQRGELVTARCTDNNDLAGMVILVPPTSAARRLAQDNEAEMHLLGVKNKYRGHGLGRRLVNTVLDMATAQGYDKMILWTQKPMQAAQQLYTSCGFVYQKEFQANGHDFLLYEKRL